MFGTLRCVHIIPGMLLFLCGFLSGRYTGSMIIETSPAVETVWQQPHIDDDPHRMHWTVPQDVATERKAECETATVSLTGGYCLTRSKHVGSNHEFDASLAKFLAEKVFHGATVVDLGAGLGHYGKLFQNTTVKKWTGYDGAINVQEATDGYVRFMDLTQPHAADERPCVGADWVLSLEVAEHIPPQYMDAFLRNIRCHAKIGAVVSWALPGQGGHHHVNNKSEEEQHAAMKRWGFQVDSEMTNEARGVAKLPWFKNTVSIYRL